MYIYTDGSVETSGRSKPFDGVVEAKLCPDGFVDGLLLPIDLVRDALKRLKVLYGVRHVLRIDEECFVLPTTLGDCDPVTMLVVEPRRRADLV